MSSWNRIKDNVEHETEAMDCEEAYSYVKQVFKHNVKRDVEPEILVRLVGYIEEQFFECHSEFNWIYSISVVVRFGSFRSFQRFVKEYQNEELIYPVILETADDSGRLKTVVTWLDDLDLIKESLESYKWHVENVLRGRNKSSERITKYLENAI